jgi:hypothetical protein
MRMCLYIKNMPKLAHFIQVYLSFYFSPENVFYEKPNIKRQIKGYFY